jgi:hypothetical protein
VAFLSDMWTQTNADSTGRASLLEEPVRDSRLRMIDGWTGFWPTRPTHISINPREVPQSPTDMQGLNRSCGAIARF